MLSTSDELTFRLTPKLEDLESDVLLAVSVAFWIVTDSPLRVTVPGAAIWLPVTVSAFPALTLTLPLALPTRLPLLVTVSRVDALLFLATPAKRPEPEKLMPLFLILTDWLSLLLASSVPMLIAPPA